MEAEEIKEYFSLARFVQEVELPHRAKVTEGYYEEGDIDGNREFSNGEVIDVRRVICPLVCLSYQDSSSQKISQVSVSTRNQNLRYRVLTRKDITTTAKPRVFHKMQDIIDAWPLVIKAVGDLQVNNQSPGITQNQEIVIRKGDELKLIRVIKTAGAVFLECRLRRTMQFVWLPASLKESFVEISDQNAYTLHELVDVSLIDRNLRIDHSVEKQLQVPNGIPQGYSGVLKMEKPEVFAEICRVLYDEDSQKEVITPPILVPIDCDIQLSPRDPDYVLAINEPLPLKELLENIHGSLPVIARIVEWTEHSGVLINQVTRPGDLVLLYFRTSVDKVLAHCGNKYFMLPTSHPGCFLRINSKTKTEADEVKLDAIEKESFPFNVEYRSTDAYMNTRRDDLPTTEPLTLDAFVKSDECVVMSKLFGDIIGNGFHLSLRTNITVRLEKIKIKDVFKTPSQMSVFDLSPEEISESQFNEIIKRHSATDRGQESLVRNAENLAPPVPSRDLKPSRSFNDSSQHTISRRRIPPAPLTKEENNETLEPSEDEDEGYYSYIDVAAMEAERRMASSYPTHVAGIVIPSNGDISRFTTDEMLCFARENHASEKAMSAFRKERINGFIFANMTDEDLTRLDFSNPISKFFRDRSKMSLIIYNTVCNNTV